MIEELKDSKHRREEFFDIIR